jgi:hypothetical protein
MITSASEVFWSVNFGEVQKLKAVLIIGELSSSGEYYTFKNVEKNLIVKKVKRQIEY